MDKLGLDFNHLQGVVSPDPNRIPVKGNEHRLIRVAFDVFKLQDNKEDLWVIQSNDDGEEYLVRTYSTDDDGDQQIAESDWEVVMDKAAANLTVFYKTAPIHRVAARNFGANTIEDALALRDALQDKLTNDVSFVTKLAQELPRAKREALVALGAPIDPAELAKTPGEDDEPYHGPGFQQDEPEKVDGGEIDMIARRKDDLKAIRTVRAIAVFSRAPRAVIDWLNEFEGHIQDRLDEELGKSE